MKSCYGIMEVARKIYFSTLKWCSKNKFKKYYRKVLTYISNGCILLLGTGKQANKGMVYKMKLFEYVTTMTKNGTEVTITDKEYDTETYVYNDKPSDKWDELIIELEKMVDVVEVKSWGTVVVDFTKLLEKNIDKIKQSDLFNSYDIENLVCSMDNIISGYVSEEWLEKFIKTLK